MRTSDSACETFSLSLSANSSEAVPRSVCGGGVQVGAASAIAIRASARSTGSFESWASSQSVTSLIGRPSTSPSGRSMILTTAALPYCRLATSVACSPPRGSLSAGIATRRPWSTESSSSLLHLRAPPGFVVAVSPMATRLSASFSPSQTKTQSFSSAARSSGSR